MRQHAIKTALAAIVLAAGLATGAGAQETIKVGVIQPLTGAFAASGNYVANGAKIAADEINAKGGVLGKKIELVIEDNKSNPTEAAAVAEKLIVRDKVPVMMGAWGSGFTLAIMPKLMEYKVPMLVETSSAGKITTSGNPYIFRISPPSAVEAVAFAKIVDQLKIGKADFLVVNNDWGRGAAEDFGKMFKEHNIKVGLVETMDPPAQDMSAQLAKIKASDADTLIITTAVEQLTLIFKQAAALGLEEADHHHRRLAEPRSADRAGGCGGERHHPHHLLHALEPRCVGRSGHGESLHRRVEEARPSVRRLDRELPRL